MERFWGKVTSTFQQGHSHPFAVARKGITKIMEEGRGKFLGCSSRILANMPKAAKKNAIPAERTKANFAQRLELQHANYNLQEVIACRTCKF